MEKLLPTTKIPGNTKLLTLGQRLKGLKLQLMRFSAMTEPLENSLKNKSLETNSDVMIPLGCSLYGFSPFLPMRPVVKSLCQRVLSRLPLCAGSSFRRSEEPEKQ